MNYAIRKDQLPENTVLKIKTILNSINIEPVVRHVCENEGNIYSLYIELGDTGIGVNGKGVNRNFAEASAYGELMERLQGGVLIEPWINIESSSTKKISKKELLKFIENKSDEHFKNQTDMEKILDRLITIKPELCIGGEYFDVFNKEIKVLPENLILELTGTNGLCAGNTPLEAICQGICEVLERYALKQIMLSNYIPLKIPEEYYKELSSYHLINYIQSKGYSCEVFECTLEGKIPVLGVILIDSSQTRYTLSMGADIDMDIALQRCLTEALQGNNLGVSYQFNMNEIVNLNLLDDNFNIKSKYIENEYEKHIINGSGYIPFHLFLQEKYAGKDIIKVFNKCANNIEAYKYLCNIIKKHKWQLYVKDYSFLGFPTFRVFISNITVTRISFSDYAKKAITKQQIREIYYKKEKGIEKKILKLLETLNEEIGEKSFLTINEILHIKNKNDISVLLFEVCLLMACGKHLDAYNKYKIYFKNKKNDKYVEMVLFALANKPEDMERINKFIKKNSNNCLFDEFNQFMKMYKDIIMYKNVNLYEKYFKKENYVLEKLYDYYEKIISYKQKFSPSLTNYKNLFYN